MGGSFAEWEFLGGETFPVAFVPTPAQGSLLGASTASPEDRSLCVRRKLMASRMMEALSRWELTL